MTHNQIDYHNAKETERHNRMMEAETNRHQLRQEELQEAANALQARMTDINQAHYERLDTETARSNRAREVETFRSNLASEDIKSAANEISAAMNAENIRHNEALESLQAGLNASTIAKNTAETSYANENTEFIQAKTLDQLAQLSVTKAQAEKTQAESKKAAAEAEKAQKENEWYTSDKIVNYSTESLSAIGNVVKVLAPLFM